MAIRTLSADLEAIARQELNEDPARLEADLKHIREWLAKQPHLTARTDSQWLTTFLRGCKFSLERTKTKMDMYYTLRTALPEIFTNRDPMLPEIQHILKLGIFLPLPLPDELGRRVILMRSGIYRPEEVAILNLFKTNMMLADVLLDEDDRASICGTVNVMDHSNLTMAHMSQFSPFLVKKMTTLFQDGYPIRPKGMNHINMNAAFTTVFNLFKSFMKEKMRKRLYVHPDMESLYKTVPKRLLPLEYGGEAGPLDELIEEWKKKVEARRSWFIEGEKYRSDEKKRPGGRPKTQEDLFGLEGSFRQLNVD
ncbi:Retinol-binding protein pinta [Cryptotermes secundus]|uniref:Retinol-binding protein pinta n=2 Tax=Cryptotermes secundus TaxID=105785 RepID=A0A2J7Q750_9NEOP|nr:Retinol-binding protein pinta [Cryptotermes secundus]PNF24412.1 Retinol-binding protein pinta [Cryptotermes secundus]